jgi:hypothetical protein
MLPTYSVKKGGLRYRYYASRPTLKGERSRAAIHRIAAPAFEAFMFATLARLGLSGDDVVPSVVRRIEILSASIVIRLDRAAVPARWRLANPDTAGQRDRALLDQQRLTLSNGETLEDNGETLTLSLPVKARFRGGSSSILHPQGSAETRRAPDTALLKAVARAHRWRQMLQDGEVPSIDALATRIGQDRGHVGLTLSLAFLSPAMTRAIVCGEQPPGLRLSHLLGIDIPLIWSEQLAAIAHLANGPAA